MPKVTGDSHSIQNDNFGYSAVGLDKLGSSEYTLVTIVMDVSGSVAAFQTELENCLKSIIQSCKHSPRADFLMIRNVLFSDTVVEHHGFKLLSEISESDYDGVCTPHGMTALFDSTNNAVRAMTDFGKQLTDQDYSVNAILIVVTDGDDNRSIQGKKAIKDALVEATRQESLESLVSILIGVNIQDPSLKQTLETFHKDVGFTQFVALGDANPKTLAKLAEFISKSISAQSQALGTNGPSKSLTF